MTPERIEREREKFEAWYSRAYLPTAAHGRTFSKYQAGTYRLQHVHDAWQAWQARAAQSEWISVEDRLPEINTYVLAATSRGLVISDRVCDYGRGKEWVSGHSDNPITHWQPLPAPPTTNHAA